MTVGADRGGTVVTLDDVLAAVAARVSVPAGVHRRARPTTAGSVLRRLVADRARRSMRRSIATTRAGAGHATTRRWRPRCSSRPTPSGSPAWPWRPTPSGFQCPTASPDVDGDPHRPPPARRGRLPRSEQLDTPEARSAWPPRSSTATCAPFVDAVRGRDHRWASACCGATSPPRARRSFRAVRVGRADGAAVRERAEAFFAAAEPWLGGLGRFTVVDRRPRRDGWFWDRTSCCLWYQASAGSTVRRLQPHRRRATCEARRRRASCQEADS